MSAPKTLVDRLVNYEVEIIKRLATKESLVVLAKGLSIDKILLSIIKPYCDSTDLVLILNGTCDEISRINLEISCCGVKNLPKRISNLTQKKRKQQYEKGGVYFVSSAVLTLDFLKTQVNRKVTGIIILKAEKCLKSYDESFIVGLARGNGVDFVQAFTDCADQISKKLQKTLDCLKMENVHLFPRFHELVKSDFSRSSPMLENIEIEITESMSRLQRLILDLLQKSVVEVRKSGVGMGKFSVESMITWNGLESWIEEHVEPVWDVISESCRQTIRDLKELKQLAYALNYTNPVNFYFLAEKIKKEHLDSHDLGWMEWESSMEIFKIAKQRIYGPKGEINFEVPPKWEIFMTLIRELKAKKNDRKNIKIVIICKNYSSVNVIWKLLHFGTDGTLMEYYKKLVLGTDDTIESDLPALPDLGEIYISVSQNKENSFGISSLLDDMEPETIIVFEVNLGVIREIESYKARRPTLPCRVITLTYSNSIEEQQFLTTSKKEVKAFEDLIEEKELLTKRLDLKHVGTNQDGRKGRKVIVDTREFRSDLPAMLYRNGFYLEPAMLDVGDYVLSPTVCVERKSLMDLIGSINNGRLFTQLSSMKRHYTRPVLLIEFEEGKPFALRALRVKSYQITKLMEKLVLTILHFPSVRILWSASSTDTALMFGSIKEDDENPDLHDAQHIISEKSLDSGRYNTQQVDMLLNLPGVNSVNVHLLLDSFENMKELSQARVEKLTNVLGSSDDSKRLYEFFNKPSHNAFSKQPSEKRKMGNYQLWKENRKKC